MINGHLDDCKAKGKPIADDEYCHECGPRRRMREGGQRGGSSKSRRKRRASKRNAKKGGRPQLKGGPTQLAKKLGISRQHASNLLRTDSVKTYIKNRKV